MGQVQSSHDQSESRRELPALPNLTEEELSQINWQDLRDPRHIEREMKYFVSLDRLCAELELDAYPKSELRQAYFPEEMSSLMIRFATEMMGIKDIPADMDLSYARVRRVRDEAGTTYHLQVKGTVDGLLPEERIELSIPITKTTYKLLKLHATEGVLHKERHVIPGVLNLPDGSKLEVAAEVDVIRRANGTRAQEGKPESQFALIEIELPEREHIDLFRSGDHSFTFLDSAIDLHQERRLIRKAVSSRTLAHVGFTPATRAVIEELLSRD